MDLEQLHPLPRAIARELATVPGLWVEDIIARFPQERPDLVRLAVCALRDAGVAWLSLPGTGRIALRPWAREAIKSLRPVEVPLHGLDPVAT